MNLQGKRKSTNIKDVGSSYAVARAKVDLQKRKRSNTRVGQADDPYDELDGAIIQNDVRQAIQEDDPQKAVKRTHGR